MSAQPLPSTSQTIVAEYADAPSARRAMAMLAGNGVPAEAVSFAGSVVAAPDTATELVRKDRSVIMRIFWAGLWWGVAGAFVGAGIGYGFAMLEFPTENVAIQVASWAMFVHIAATLWAAYAVIDDGTPQGPPARASSGAAPMVIVRTADAFMLERAERALRESGAFRVRRS
jgi:hypothetical protein